MREKLSGRLREFGIRAQLPKLELPKLTALAELVEAHVASKNVLGRRWLKNVLLTLVLLLEEWFETPATQHASLASEPREQSTKFFTRVAPVGNLALLGQHARVLWCCFRN